MEEVSSLTEERNTLALKLVASAEQSQSLTGSLGECQKELKQVCVPDVHACSLIVGIVGRFELLDVFKTGVFHVITYSFGHLVICTDSFLRLSLPPSAPSCSLLVVIFVLTPPPPHTQRPKIGSRLSNRHRRKHSPRS